MLSQKEVADSVILVGGARFSQVIHRRPGLRAWHLNALRRYHGRVAPVQVRSSPAIGAASRFAMLTVQAAAPGPRKERRAGRRLTGTTENTTVGEERALGTPDSTELTTSTQPPTDELTSYREFSVSIGVGEEGVSRATPTRSVEHRQRDDHAARAPRPPP
jgi:hypothetical protein